MSAAFAKVAAKATLAKAAYSIIFSCKEEIPCFAKTAERSFGKA